MDNSAYQLLKVVRVSSWAKTKAQLLILAEAIEPGSVQRQQFEEVVDQFINHIEENNLHK